ncbi:MAG: signal peptidase I, partial [Chloroflexota bacterium]|nr:signal peptidase I [Chloroflexota bacterium]
MSAAIREFIEAVLLALLVFFLIQVSVQNFRVEGSSMEPTLENAEYLLVNKMVYQKIDMQRLAGLIPFWLVKQPDKRFVFHQPRRGDVIVFRYPLDPQRDFVKRVVGGPGDTVEIRRGTVYVNNVPLDE